MKPHKTAKKRTATPHHSGVPAYSSGGQKHGNKGGGIRTSNNADKKARGKKKEY